LIVHESNPGMDPSANDSCCDAGNVVYSNDNSSSESDRNVAQTVRLDDGSNGLDMYVVAGYGSNAKFAIGMNSDLIVDLIIHTILLLFLFLFGE
jgi:hypothetical protein